VSRSLLRRAILVWAVGLTAYSFWAYSFP
jgi:hypothetical protein